MPLILRRMPAMAGQADREPSQPRADTLPGPGEGMPCAGVPPLPIVVFRG